MEARAAPSEPPRLGRNRDFALLWVGQALSTLGTRISWVAYPLLVLGLTHSPARAGVVAFAGTAPAVVFGLPAGAIVDRVRRRALMIACDAGRALTVASIPIALAAGVLTYWQLLAAAFVERTLSVFFDPAHTGAIAQIVPAEQLPLAIARNESREYGAFLVGPPVGGALYAAGRALPFVADAVSYCASLLALLFMRGPFQEARPPAATRLWRDVRDGLAYLWRQPFLRITTLVTAGSNFVSNGIGLAAILVARERGASPAAVGVMLTIGGAGGLCGSLLAPLLQPRLRATTIVGLGTWSWTALIPLFAVAPNAYALGVLLGLVLLLAPPWNAAVFARRLALIPDRLQGRVQSAGAIFSVGAAALGMLAAGFLLEHVGRTWAALVFAAAMASIALAATAAPSVRRALA